MWVLPINNFAWNHYLVNIHEIMHVDILHQLLKGIVHRLKDWVQEYIKVRLGSGSRARKRSSDGARVDQSSWTTRLDDRFCQVPEIAGLRLFPHFSNVSQWTGNEQKALIRQIVPVVAPFLEAPAMQFTRAVVDFVLLAQYHSHDDNTLQYMENALLRMNLLKFAFEDFLSTNQYNYPKWHAMTHWTDSIRKFGSADGFDSAHFEAAHIYCYKVFYDLTNKRSDFEEQVLHHNTRRINMLAMDDLLIHRKRALLRQAAKDGHNNPADEKTNATSPARHMDLTPLRWIVTPKEEQRRKAMGLSHKHWRFACTVAYHTGIDDFVGALAIFVREERRRINIANSGQAGLASASRNRTMERPEADPSWVSNYFICVHASIRCWKAGMPESHEMEPEISEEVRCSPAWQKKVARGWRRDCVWVQEYDPSDPTRSKKAESLKGRLPGELQIVITVIDEGNLDDRGKASRYTGAFIELFGLKDGGRHNNRHGMIEVQRAHSATKDNIRSLARRRFYRLNLVQRSAHLVPAGRSKPGTYYVNPYVDWDSYNSIYDPNFATSDLEIAARLARNRA
jgi:hypothetical protein